MKQLDYLSTETYTSEDLLTSAVERGALDMGLVLPAGFDSQLQQVEETRGFDGLG